MMFPPPKKNYSHTIKLDRCTVASFHSVGIKKKFFSDIYLDLRERKGLVFSVSNSDISPL